MNLREIMRWFRDRKAFMRSGAKNPYVTVEGWVKFFDVLLELAQRVDELELRIEKLEKDARNK